MRKFTLLCSCLFLSLLPENAARAQMVIYSNALVNGWQNYGWATLNYTNTSPVYDGSEYSISVTITSAYAGIQLYHPYMTDTSYASISFWLNGGASGGQHLQMYGMVDTNGTVNTALTPRYGLSTPVTNTWVQYTVSLSSLGAADLTNFTGFVIQDSNDSSEPTFYLDDIQLNSATPLTASAGANQTNCTGGSAVTIGGSPTATGGAGGYTYSWSPSTGLSSTTVANPTASPSSTTTYTVTVTDSSEATAHSSMTLTISPNEAATASAGGNQTITAGSNTAGLGGVVGGGATGGIWTTSGSGAFSPNTTTLNATYDPSAADITAGTVTLTLTTTGQLSPCGAATAEVVVTIQSTMMIYSNALVNGWVNYSYGTTLNFANTSPVYTGCVDSISAAITGAYDGIQLYHAPMMDTAYTSIGFLLNGGASGGQNLKMYGNLGTGPTGQGDYYNLSTPLANTWQQYWVPLSALGVADVTNFSGFAIQDSAGTSEPTFYLDNIQLSSYAAPPLTPLTVNASQPIRTADARWFGLNTAVWDSYLDTSDTVTLLTNMGMQALRYPGGSDSDNFHWISNGLNGGGYVASTATVQSFIQLVTNISGETMITMNYGTGTSNEAAAWVAYVNAATNSTTNLGTDQYGINWQTAGYWASLRAAAKLGTDDGKNYLRLSHPAPFGFKYWEIGNEVYGASWETDSNNVPHDPYTYAVRSQGYISLIKAVDSAVKVGVVVETGEDNYANNTDHLVTNPVTGLTHYGWTPVLLTYLKILGATPDFAIFHNYPYNPGGESDSGLLQSSEPPSGWAYDAANLRMMITDYMGTNIGTNIELVCTENNSVSSAPGKQSVSLVNGLYKLDSLAQLMQTEFNGLFWWDLRNGQDTGNNNSNSLYGWRDYGDYGVVNADSDTGETDLYPTYYTTELMTNFVQTGDTVITAASDYSLLTSYAVQRQNGNLTVLTINKDPSNTLTGQISLSGFHPSSSGVVYSYGIPQDDAVENDSGSPNPAQTTISLTGTNISYAFAPYSATVIVLSPTTLAASAGGAKTICAGSSTSIGGSPTANGGAGGYTYSWSPSTGLSSTTVANPTASPTTTTTYTVTVTDSWEATAQSSVTVTVHPLPTVGVNSPAICAGGSATLTATTSASSPGYLWSPGGATTASITVSPASTTAYTVTVTDGTTGCVNSGSGTVTVHALPTVSVNSPAICTGGSATLTATTGASSPGYLWSPGGATTGSITVSPASTTAYTVTVTDGTTGCANSGSGTVTVNPAATASAGGNQRICAGSSTAALGGSIGGGATGGAWTTSGSGSFAPNATTLNATYNPSAGDITAGTVTLTLTSTGQLSPCGAATAQVVVTITNPSFSITSSSLDITGTNFVVCWHSVPGIVYNVLTNTSVNTPQSWAVAGGPITATNTNTCFTLPGGILGNTNVNVVIQQ